MRLIHRPPRRTLPGWRWGGGAWVLCVALLAALCAGGCHDPNRAARLSTQLSAAGDTGAPDATARLAAAQALVDGGLASSAALEKLEAIAADPADPVLAAKAGDAATTIRAAMHALATAATPEAEAAAAQPFIDAGAGAVPAVVLVFTDPNPAARGRALRTLSAMGYDARSAVATVRAGLSTTARRSGLQQLEPGDQEILDAVASITRWAWLFELFGSLINGITLGAIYALIAVGYTMVYGIIKLINFAHGEVFMLGTFVGLIALNQWGMGAAGLLVALPFAMVACLIIGAMLDWTAYLPLRRNKRLPDIASTAGIIVMALIGLAYFITWQGQDTTSATYWFLFSLLLLVPAVLFTIALLERFGVMGPPRRMFEADRLSALITAIGMSLMLQTLAVMVWGPDYHTFKDGSLPESLNFTFLGVQGKESVTWVAAVVLMVGLHTLVTYTKIGKAMVTFMIGSAMAAVAGILYAVKVGGNISFRMGYYPGVIAFAAAVLGGIGNIRGAMLGGLILGLTQGLCQSYISSAYDFAFAFGAMIAVILWGAAHRIHERPHPRHRHPPRAAPHGRAVAGVLRRARGRARRRAARVRLRRQLHQHRAVRHDLRDPGARTQRGRGLHGAAGPGLRLLHRGGRRRRRVLSVAHGHPHHPHPRGAGRRPRLGDRDPVLQTGGGHRRERLPRPRPLAHQAHDTARRPGRRRRRLRRRARRDRGRRGGDPAAGDHGR
jgi:branched-chain amino acid transport system permease protein